MPNEFEMLQSVDVELDGVLHKGQFRVSGHSVIVYYAAEIKFVDYGPRSPRDGSEMDAFGPGATGTFHKEKTCAPINKGVNTVDF